MNLRSAPRVVTYALRQLWLGARGRAHPVAQLDNLSWFASPAKKLPTAGLDELFPGVAGEPVQLERAFPRKPGSLTTDELCVVAMLCRHLKPRRVFEFGTYDGRTTLTLALNTPTDAEILTLDLPHPGGTSLRTDRRDDAYQLGRRAGSFFRETPAAGKIRQIWGDSADFDESPYRGRMELVFVDASHTYEYVRNDTDKALRMLAPGGTILWHDYCVWYPGVPRHLHTLLPDRKVSHIAGTHLAVMRS